MKDLKKLFEASILGDLNDTIKISDDYIDFQDKLNLVSKINKKYDLDLFAKTDHYKQNINIGDLILCYWLGAIRLGVVIAINDNDNTLTVTFDGILNNDDAKQNKKYNKSKRDRIAYDIQPFRTLKCSAEMVKLLNKII